MKRVARSVRLQLCSADAELVACATARQRSYEASWGGCEELDQGGRMQGTLLDVDRLYAGRQPLARIPTLRRRWRMRLPNALSTLA